MCNETQWCTIQLYNITIQRQTYSVHCIMLFGPERAIIRNTVGQLNCWESVNPKKKAVWQQKEWHIFSVDPIHGSIPSALLQVLVSTSSNWQFPQSESTAGKMLIMCNCLKQPKSLQRGVVREWKTNSLVLPHQPQLDTDTEEVTRSLKPKRTGCFPHFKNTLSITVNTSTSVSGLF